ncbi:IS30 family transposase [Algoriphagus sp. NBT04N3]|jgi:transposase, IS30 family|uniref:IS30 family transposase n=1 Tax=Algoriphagus sp. NBT04N3 TaxID=2705473 RepID=UPI001C62B295|nr:IS30 family transposase [Algoriphagus sp. NBT04N3]QYH37309.1 IS30 family transposase [Algoriphagus sp. NBT04N3]QYH39157.1 IS30 family transposase [Algoriphagus sp. NBT04N3]QYH39641.1 IS30 family transposase [Algoriphagus sp. NBT04N3]QYH40878.1 IS30 family transposase [Algoriphagus sp. NBT04N3]
MQKFNHLSPEQRYQIEILIKQGVTQTGIARALGVHKSTICRELRRNTGLRGRNAGEYVARVAQNRTDERHKLKPKNIRFKAELKEQARVWLKEEKLSPELIAAKWELDGNPGVSHETIYQWIWKAKKSKHWSLTRDRELYKCLRHGKRKRKRGNYRDSRGIIKERVPIEQRPAVVALRERIGDIEVDLMMGKNHQSALLVLVDRATLITTMEKLSGKNADAIEQKLAKRIQRIGPSFFKSITFDNDMAFANHHLIRDKYNIPTYFTRPYTSQDKGTVENRIGLIRAFLPKKTDLNEISTEQIQAIEAKINNRPVRKFNYLSPIQKLKQKLGVALIS